MRRNLLMLGSIAAVVATFVVVYLLLTPDGARDDMGMGGRPEDGAHLPTVLGYAEGEEVFFVHPETSDSRVAEMLTDMMGGSPVLVVPALAEVPDTALATVYVFTNGIEGDGPLGYQPDVFDNPPGTPAYSPLRAIHRVTWNQPAEARLLKSAVDVVAAQEAGEVTIEASDVVVNMPMLRWPGGDRLKSVSSEGGSGQVHL